MTITLGTFEIVCLVCAIILMIGQFFFYRHRDNEREFSYQSMKARENKIIIYGDVLKKLFSGETLIIERHLFKYEVSIDASIRQMNKEEMKELKYIFSQWVDEKLTDVYKDAIVAKVSESDLEKLHKLTSKKEL